MIGLLQGRNVDSLRHLMMGMMILRLMMVVVHHLELLLLLLIEAATVALVASVPIAGVEAEADLREPEGLLGRHLGLLSRLVLPVVHALGVHPRAELAGVLGDDGVSVLGLPLDQLL